VTFIVYSVYPFREKVYSVYSVYPVGPVGGKESQGGRDSGLGLPDQCYAAGICN
jgi:hypothetical protein